HPGRDVGLDVGRRHAAVKREHLHGRAFVRRQDVGGDRREGDHSPQADRQHQDGDRPGGAEGEADQAVHQWADFAGVGAETVAAAPSSTGTDVRTTTLSSTDRPRRTSTSRPLSAPRITDTDSTFPSRTTRTVALPPTSRPTTAPDGTRTAEGAPGSR